VAAAVVVVIAIAAAWATLQPLRAQHAVDAAYARLGDGDPAAAAGIAEIAHRRDPVSADPLIAAGAIAVARRDRAAARRAFTDAIALEPANPETWRARGSFEYGVAHDPRAALNDFQVALQLDPHSFASISDVVQASRAIRAGGG
jgi:tetratricopeptide (TPR) repeat protein